MLKPNVFDHIPDTNHFYSDVDECAIGSHQCSNVSVCYNQNGSYGCDCINGFSGNGFNCTGELAYIALHITTYCVIKEQYKNLFAFKFWFLSGARILSCYLRCAILYTEMPRTLCLFHAISYSFKNAYVVQ